MFVTAWIGIIDLETGVMTCSNAGHEYPAIRQDDGYTLYKDRHGFVLGGMDGVKYKEYEISLKEGDRIFVYTDGVPEANDEAGNQFGTERMLAALNEEREISVTDTLMKVKQRIFEFCGEADQFDDITMLCFEFNKKSKKGNEL
jgi:sigma-B regulation protein RsbU (phosphoserine phosphatase)